MCSYSYIVLENRPIITILALNWPCTSERSCNILSIGNLCMKKKRNSNSLAPNKSRISN